MPVAERGPTGGTTQECRKSIRMPCGAAAWPSASLKLDLHSRWLKHAHTGLASCKGTSQTRLGCAALMQPASMWDYGGGHSAACSMHNGHDRGQRHHAQRQQGTEKAGAASSGAAAPQGHHIAAASSTKTAPTLQQLANPRQRTPEVVRKRVTAHGGRQHQLST